MATTHVRFLESFYYVDTVNTVNYELKVDKAIDQLDGYINSDVATVLIGLGVAKAVV